MKLGLALIATVASVLLTFAMFFTAGWTRPPIRTVQVGYRGVGMEQVADPRMDAALKAANVLPDPIDKASPDGDKATAVYQNVKVLTDLSAEQFNRVMLAITTWVAPQEQGCAYCHNVENMADDSLYTKVVARRMLEMTRHINTDWKQHVAATGVTCYTCHRGNPVPAYVWYKDPGPKQAGGFAVDNHGMGHPAPANDFTTMHVDPYSPYLEANETIRVVSRQALPGEGMGESIQKTEQTYSLMLDMSKGLGVNCGFCHNSRAFYNWEQSTPQRVVAWHGIRLARDLNVNYLDPLKPTFPAHRLGQTGDVAKVNCATCHQGVNKPLYGVSMAKDYPELGGVAAP